MVCASHDVRHPKWAPLCPTLRRKDAVLLSYPLTWTDAEAGRYDVAHVPLDVEIAIRGCSLPKTLHESMSEASEWRAKTLRFSCLTRQDTSPATCGAVTSEVQPIDLRSTTAQAESPQTSCPINILSLDVLCDILVLVLDIQHPAASKPSFATLQNVGSDASQNVKSLLTLTHVCHLWRQALHCMPWLWRELTLIWRPGMRSEGYARFADVEGNTRLAHGEPRSAQVAHVSTSSQTALWLARAVTMPLSFTVIADPRHGLSAITWGGIPDRSERRASDDAFCVNYVVELFRNPVCFPSHRIQSLRLVLLAEGHVAALASLPPTSFPELEALYLDLNHNRWPSPEDAPIVVFANSPRLRRLCLKVVWNAGAIEQRLDLPWAALTHLSLELPGSPRGAYLDIIRLCRDSLVSLQVVEGCMLRMPNAPLADLEIPIHLPRLRSLRFPSCSTCLLALDPVDLSDLHVSTASAPVLDVFLQRAGHITSLSLCQIVFQGNELRRVLGSSPSLHSLSLDQCSLRFDLFFESMMIGVGPGESCLNQQRAQGSAYVPYLERLRMVNCRNGTEALGELDIDFFLLMIRLRCSRRNNKGSTEEMLSTHRLGHVEMWPMRPSFAEECRRDWQVRGDLVLLLQQPRSTSGIWEGF